MVDDAVVVLTQGQFDSLREYSTSLPTGTTPGKQWKRKFKSRFGDQWFLGEYGEPIADPRGEGFPKRVPIVWTRIMIGGVDMAVPATEPGIVVTVAWFSKEMEQVLFDNIDKGGWQDCPFSYLIQRLEEEVKELRESLMDRDPEDVVHEAADVANFAMMIADNVRMAHKRIEIDIASARAGAITAEEAMRVMKGEDDAPERLTDEPEEDRCHPFMVSAGEGDDG